MVVSRNRRNENDRPSPMAQIFEDVDGEDKVRVEDDRVAELEAALKELRDRQEQERSDALLTAPTNWQSQVVLPTEINPNTIPLPDPALDPDGFSAATTKRAELAFENRQRREDAQRRFESDIDTKVADLWSDFGVSYPDYADDRERIDFVATSVVKAATKRGLDVNRYMFGAGRDRFMKDVAKKYDDVFGVPETDEDDYNDNSHSRRTETRDVPRRRSSSRNYQEDEDGRSAGVFGGNSGSGRASKQELNENNSPSMIDDLQVVQKKSGFF